MSIIAWMIPPIRQRQTEFFFYFLLLALSDPVTAIMQYLVPGFELWQGHVIFSSFWILSLIKEKTLKRFSPLIFVIFISLLYLVIKVQHPILQNIVALNIVIITVLITKKFVISIRETEALNIFYMVLILYNFSTIMKILFRINHGDTGYLYFFLTNFFQIFIAIFFTFYNVNNAKKIKLFRDGEVV
jgi:hypothetical protein